jgi:hypothetical protein
MLPSILFLDIDNTIDILERYIVIHQKDVV